MDFFESAEDVDRHIHRTRVELERLEGDVSSKKAMARLRRAYPYHPVLIGRGLFLLLAMVCFIAVIVVVALPYMGSLVDEEILGILHRLGTRMGVPLPVAIGAGAGLLFLAWIALTQAAVAIGRDCPLTPPEEKERDRLASELSRLTRQRQMMERARSGTPRGVRRFEVPAPGIAPSTAPIPSSYETPRPAPSYLGQARSMPPKPLPAPKATPPGDGYARFRTPATLGRETSPSRVPPARPLVETEPPYDEIETPTDQYADMPTEVAAGALVDAPEGSLVEYDSPGYVHADGSPAYVVDEVSGHGAGSFERRLSTAIPAFAEVQEPWLSDAIDKAAILAESFPIQARLEFNKDAYLPFTLVLERATPAMAVRAMMAYIEFLATIATPRFGRIELISVAHLDRNFHRNVRAAADPYFADTVRIEHEPGQVDLIFEQPDSRWDRYPALPTQS